MKLNKLLGIPAAVLLVAGTAGAQTVFFPGVLRHQYWTSDNPNGVQHPSRAQVEQGLAGDAATDTIDLTIFDTNDGGAVNYTERVSGLFIPTVTTNYVFWVNSDDDSDLFVSTDATASNKRLVAQEVGWSNVDQWHAVGSGGGSTAAQKRSDQFSPDAGATHPFAKGIPMVAGQKYWIEGVHQQGGGGENFGATFSFFGGAEPTDGAKSSMNDTNIGYGYVIPTTLTVTTQATNATASDGREATFTYVVADPLPDPLIYQWYRNGAVISNANFQQYTFLASAADNNAQYQCIVTIPPSYTNNNASTSSVAVLTVVANSVTYNNGLKIEQFNGAVRTQAESGSTGAANAIFVSTGDGSASPLDYTGAEAIPNDNINNYGRRMSGWFTPTADGQYVFFLSSDDDADLFISSDATPANKTLIASENNWSGSRSWTNSGGGSIVSQKRSDQWTNAAGDTPFSSGIMLKSGTAYYIEADSHQGGGGDNLGVLAKLVSDPDPTNGAPPIPAAQLSFKSTVATNLSWTTQPKALSLFDPSQAIFTGTAKSDSEFAVLYQWQRDGTNIAGATRSSYSFTATLADNASVWTLIAATAEAGLSITSAPVTLTVRTAVPEPGLALMNYWINQDDQTVGEQGLFGPPDFVMAIPNFECGINNENGDHFVNELSGFFIPATTGSYDFIVTGDDAVDFFISTDSNPLNKRLVCRQPNWANALVWSGEDGSNNGGGGADDTEKNSATYTNAAGVAQNPNGIALNASTKYYIDMWHHEGTGGDSMAAYVKKHSDPAPANGTDGNITGSVLSFNAPNTSTFIAFTNQPVDATVLSGQTASFTAGGESDGKIVIGTTGQFQTSTATGATNFLKFPNVLFQWYRNSTLIPGATTSTYTTPALKPGDSAQYYAAIRALGIQNWSNSTTVSLTVIADTNPPTVYAAEFDEGQSLIPTVSVSFSKTMDLSTITNINNYNISGAQITAILVDTNDARHVQLQLAGEPTTLPIQLTLTGITDFSGNPPATTTVSVVSAGLTNTDIGDITKPDPAWPGYMYADGAGAYTIVAQGSDIWGTADAFNYSYESKTGDFDVAVRQISDTEGLSNSSKGGLMVRETLDSASRNWTMNNQPRTGSNSTESNARETNSAATVSWQTGVGTTTPPAYPNAWLRIKRTGQLLQAFWSTNADASSWTRQAIMDVSTNTDTPLPATVFVGIDVCSHANDAQDVTVFHDYYTGVFANYTSSYVAPTNTPQATLSASISGGNVVISWTPSGGTLQSSPAVGAGASWSPVGTANPATIPLSGASSKFFRVGP